LSQRGYVGSTPLTKAEADCAVSPSQLHRTHTSDFASFIQYCGTKLGLPDRSKEGGGITIVFWSKGCAAATGLFYYMDENPPYGSLIDKYVSSMVLYEAPKSAVFGLQARDGEALKVLFVDQLTAPKEDPGFIFNKYVTGFYKNTPEYIANKGGPQITEYYRAGVLEPDFQQYSAKIVEATHLQSILYWFLEDAPAERYEACHKAIQKMAKSSLKTVGILWGAEGPPEFLEGSWIAEKWLDEEATRLGEKSKARPKQFPGGNHYIQFYDPKGFWDAMLEISA
jgi:hypothetical protein